MGRCFEVHTVEVVERIYTVEFHGSDLDRETLKNEAKDLVGNGEIDKFREISAHIDDIYDVKEVE